MPYLRKIYVFIILLIFTSTGCATLEDAKNAKGTGPYRIYAVNQENIWKTMPDVLNKSGLEYVSQNRKEGQMLAKRGVTMFSYGEEVAIFITPLEEQKTRVEIVSKKAMSTNIFAPNWSVKLFQVLDGLFAPVK